MDAAERRLPEVFTRRQALLLLSRHQVEWALASGRWVTLRRGIYCRRTTLDQASGPARHLLHAQAALASHDDRHVLSHLSAALTYDLPGPLVLAAPPTVTIGAVPASTDRQADLIVQAANLRPVDAWRWRDWQRTSPSRTVADCLRHLPAPDAVAIGDAAIRTELTSPERIQEVLAWQAGWPYAERGRAAGRLLDGRRETWLESYSFVVLHQEGIPLPTPQVEVFDEDGDFIGRVDGLWADHATVAEADGRDKYSLATWPDLVSAGADELAEARHEAGRRVLIAEKVREDRLRGVGLEVVRWGTYDAAHRRTELARRVRSAWRRADPARFTGRLVRPVAHASWPSSPG